MIASLASSIAQSLARNPDRIAVIDGDKAITYAELEELVARFAGGLAGHGAGVDSRIIIQMNNGWEWIVAFQAALRIGAVLIPVNALLTLAEVGYIAAHAEASHAVLDQAHAGLLPHLAGQHRLCGIVAGGGRDDPLSFASLLAADPLREPVARPPESLAAICYTSGTTGRPKGAMISQQALALNAAMVELMHGRTADDVTVSALPLPHVYGNVVANATLRAGGTLVIFATFETARIWEALERHRATTFEGVPTMYYYLLADAGNAPRTGLRLCTVGGQTMPVDKMAAAEALLACPLIELWGMTELAGLGTTHPHTGPYLHGSIGTALPFMEARIAAEDSSAAASPGEVGELIVRGPLVTLGYLNDPAATADAVTADGWLRTGDLAYKDPGGFIHVVDRKKDMILTAGYNVYPAELERAISSHPAVAMVAVGRLADELKGEIAAAYIVLKPGMSADAAAIEAHCRAQLAPYKVPRRIRFVPDLPKTSTGKILRRSLAELEKDHEKERL